MVSIWKTFRFESRKSLMAHGEWWQFKRLFNPRGCGSRCYSLVSCLLLDFSLRLMRSIMLVMSWQQEKKQRNALGNGEKSCGTWKACENVWVKVAEAQCWHKQTLGHLSALEWLQRQQQQTHKDLTQHRALSLVSLIVFVGQLTLAIILSPIIRARHIYSHLNCQLAGWLASCSWPR